MNNTLNFCFVLCPRALAVAAAFLSMSLPTRAASADIGEYVGTVIVPEGLSTGQVQEAITNTLIGRQWGVKSESNEVVVGYLKHRSSEATVTLTYDMAKVDIHCVGWAINKKTGERRKPEQPRGWLKNIQVDLTKHLNLAATNS